MSETQWMPLRCASCDGLFKIPADDSEGIVECPHCQSLLASPTLAKGTILTAEPIKAAAPSSKAPRPIQQIPTETVIPKNLKRLAVGGVTAYLDQAKSDGVDAKAEQNGGHLPPVKKKPNYTPPDMIVHDANPRRPRDSDAERKAEAEAVTAPLMNFASADDERFALDPNAPAPRRVRVSQLSSGKKVSLTGWDKSETDSDDSPQVVPPLTAFLRKLKRPALVALVLVFAGLVVYGVVSMKSGDSAKVPILETESPKGSDNGGIDGNAFDVKFAENARQAMMGFLGTKTMDERLRWVREPERVRPLMERYYADHDFVIDYRDLRPVGNIYGDFAMSDIELNDFSTTVIAAELQRGETDDAAEAFKVDWESFVGYSEMTFAEFREKKPQEPVLFRVRAFPDNYYNYGFDQARYYCLRVEEVKTGDILYGYAAKDSPTGETILKEMQSNTGFFVLRLSFPPDGKAENQTVVEEFVQRGWVIREITPDEDALKIEDIDASAVLPAQQ